MAEKSRINMMHKPYVSQLRQKFQYKNREIIIYDHLSMLLPQIRRMSAEKNDVAYDFNLNVPKFINMEEVDICKAFVNIFDNAINAAKALEDNRYKDKELR